MNYEALTIRAAELARSGQYVELEKVCKKILSKKSKHFDALQLLGFAQSQKGQLNDAIRNLKLARKLDPEHASVRINLANACLRKGLTDDAIKFSREAVKLNSSLFEGQIALANALQMAKHYEEAEQVYEQALRSNPTSAEATDGLGECYKNLGKLAESVARFTRANQLNTTLPTVYIHLFQAYMLMQTTDDALKVAYDGLTRMQLPAAETYELWIGKAKIAWLSGDLDEVQKALDQAEKVVVTDNTYENIVNLQAYEHCLRRLLKERSEHPQPYLGESENTIYFVAESHALAPSEVVVDYKDSPHRIRASLITGCKAWHLASEGENEYKASLNCFFSTIPTRSTVVLGFGEIDCRLSEGILKAWHDKEVDYHLSICSLVENYLKSLVSLAETAQHELIIYGVPAPNTELLMSPDQVHEAELVEVIQLFNADLKQQCEVQGLVYLDVYALTVDENGKSNMIYHIDGYHLHPTIFPLLFEAL